ncbi:DUF305 domain-containing protein [Streptomyces hirsutus]|uniref:DUF305 domain-containing protein n=1 Tax=Streptomyces hirsutus TaxID=35620 RepID=UPI0036B59CB8
MIAGSVALVVPALTALTMSTGTREEDDQAVTVPAADSADAGFARDMSVHHRQAVEMAYIIRDRTGNDDIRRFAYDVAQTQANQRGMMLGRLDLWGLPKTSSDGYMRWMQDGHTGHGTNEDSLMPGMATTAELDRLGSLDGEQAEILFLQFMIDHHRAGVDMARACVSQCEVEAEQRLARTMVEGQQSEIELMTDLLKERGAAPRK